MIEFTQIGAIGETAIDSAVLEPRVCNTEQTRGRGLSILRPSGVCLMSCQSCASLNEKEFATEMMIHLSGPMRDKPGVLAFPKIAVCLDCGNSRFTTTGAELRMLRDGTAASVTAAT